MDIRHTDKQTCRLYDWPGPEGTVSENDWPPPKKKHVDPPPKKEKKEREKTLSVKIGNMLMTRLKVDKSNLNSHGFNIGLNLSPLCTCGEGQETMKHFLTSCNRYNSIRQTMQCLKKLVNLSWFSHLSTKMIKHFSSYMASSPIMMIIFLIIQI